MPLKWRGFGVRQKDSKLKISGLNKLGISKKKKHVIIGNSAAALSAIQAIRAKESDSHITLISAECEFAYPPVLLTYYISKKIKREDLFLVDHNFYRNHKVELLLGIRATKVDPSTQSVHLANGKKVEYDDLLIATGSIPKRLDIDGQHLKGVFSLKTLGDADRIMKSSPHMKDIVFIGGGLIGLQTANALFRKGRKMTFVVASKQLLSQNVDENCARLVEEQIRKFGLILFGTNISYIRKTRNKLRIGLNPGKSIDADAVIVGKGVTPNTEPFRGTGIMMNDGIIVDETMRTSIPNVFAAGDVAEGTHIVTGKKQVVATWTNAFHQGKTAGTNMAGGKKEFFSLNENISTIFGIIIGSAGLTKADGVNFTDVVYADPGNQIYRKIVLNKRDEIVGAISLGKVDGIGLINHLIRNRVEIPGEFRNDMVRSALRSGEYLSHKGLYRQLPSPERDTRGKTWRRLFR